MKLRALLNNLPIRYKVVIACTALFIPFAVLAGALSYSVMRHALETQINSELRNATESVRNMVQTSVRLSIRNYLRSVSETNSAIIKSLYQQQLSGKLTEAQAKARAAEVLLAQKIAHSGYLYCVDSQGNIVVHPQAGVLGRKLSDVPFVNEQMRRKNGYIEYDWKNPVDTMARPKALWMTYFEPWDWIVSASAYRDEFDQVVNIDDFRKSIQSLKFMNSGYSYVLDARGDLIVHPSMQGENVFASGLDTPEEVFTRMLAQKKGEYRYGWKNPGEETTRQKVVVFDHVPEVDWFVASAAYLDDLYGPINTIRNIAAMVAALCLLGGGVAAMRISTSITGPIRLLMERFSLGATGDYSVRMEYRSRDEIGQLSDYFNRFMTRLETEIRERRRMELLLIGADDQERVRIGQDLHDDLAPHLIGIEVMSRVLHKKLLAQGSSEVGLAETIGSLMGEATRKTRALARGLCPIQQVEEGLGFALRELAESVSTIFGVACRVEAADGVRLPGAVAIHVYRIAQEAVHNAVKHAQAGQILIALRRDSELLILEVRDDGRGFGDGDGPGGMGLRIMDYRARLIGASLEIGKAPERGTRVWLCLQQEDGEQGEA